MVNNSFNNVQLDYIYTIFACVFFFIQYRKELIFLILLQRIQTKIIKYTPIRIGLLNLYIITVHSSNDFL